MSQKAWYLDSESSQVGKSAILIGDPSRVDRIGKLLVSPKLVTEKRGLRTITGTYSGNKVTIAAFGMGSPIACIVMEELRQLGINIFLRIGTTMVLPPNKKGEFYISKDSLPMEGTSKSYISEGLIPKANKKLIEQISASAANNDVSLNECRFASFDAFYRDMYPLTKDSNERVESIHNNLCKKGVSAIDMETSALMAAAHFHKLKFTSLCVGTVDSKTRQKLPFEEFELLEKKLFQIALEGLRLFSIISNKDEARS